MPAFLIEGGKEMNKTVWITGGSRGIGAATVREFAKCGYNVAFTYQKSEDKANMLCNELANYPVIAIKGDMANRMQVENSYKQIKNKFGAIDTLVVNAGIAQQKMFCDITDDDWNKMFNVNLNSAFYTIQTVLPDMVHEKQGSIVTVSSVWGITGASCESHYAASKAALIGLTKSLALELGLSGIRVNSVAAGVIDTDMNSMHDEQTLNELANESALGRIGKTEEIARLIRSLCSEDTSFVTGQVIAATGGFII